MEPCASTPLASRAQDNKNSTAQAKLANLGARLQAIINAFAVAGVLPLHRIDADWLIERSIESDAAAGILRTLLGLADVLAAQTAMIVEGGASRSSNAAEATALRQEATNMRTCRRLITPFRRDVHAARAAQRTA